MPVLTAKDYKKKNSVGKEKENSPSPESSKVKREEERPHIEWSFLYPEFSPGERVSFEKEILVDDKKLILRVVNNVCTTTEEKIAKFLFQKKWELLYEGPIRK